MADYGTVPIGRSESSALFGMPDQNLTKPPELPTPAPAQQVGVQSGSEPVEQEFNRMQPAPNSPPISAPPNPDPQSFGEGPQRIPYWLQRSERFLRVIIRLYLGLLVCWAPWWTAFWDNNPFFASPPSLRHFVTLGAVRGLVSGLGILNLWIAVREALRKSDGPEKH